MKDNSKVLGALILGAAAGAVLGLMFAPSRGSDLRKKLKDSAEDIIDELADKITEGRETIDELKEKVMGRADNLKSEMEDIGSDYMGNGERVKTRKNSI